MEPVECTLILLIKNNSRFDRKIILATGKKGFGKNTLTTYGGKVDPGETIIESAIRELKEESDVDVTENELEEVCLLNIDWPDNVPGLGVESDRVQVHVFIAHSWTGTPIETESMSSPKELDLNNLPYAEMSDDVKYWFPYIILGTKFFSAYFEIGQDKKVKRHKIMT